jgi:hypothetical protein
MWSCTVTPSYAPNASRGMTSVFLAATSCSDVYILLGVDGQEGAEYATSESVTKRLLFLV